MEVKKALAILREILDELPDGPTDIQLDTAAVSCSYVGEILRRAKGPTFTFIELHSDRDRDAPTVAELERDMVSPW